MTLPYHSVSQINTFLHCEKKFWFQYIAKAKPVLQPQIQLMRGKALHDTLEDFFKLPFCISCNDLWYLYLDNYFKYIKERDGEFLRAAEKIIRKYYEFFVKMHSSIISTEQRKKFSIQGINFLVIADVVIDDCVIDWKTSNKILKTINAEYKRQLTFYCLGFKKKKASIINICMPKAKISRINYSPSKEDYLREIRTLKNLNNAYNDKNHKYPATGLNKIHLCPYCDFAEQCVPFQRRKEFMR